VFALEPSSSNIDLDEKITLRVTSLSCAQVCQQWRLAARDCCILWPNAVDFQWQLPEVIADLLPLSRPHPIDIGHRAAPFRIAKQRDIAVLNLLKAESSRIHEWNVEFPLARQRHSMPGWVFPSQATDQPLVTALRYTGEVTSPLWDLQALSPNLQKLSIRNVRSIRPLQDTVFFNTLTELWVSNVSKVNRPSHVEWHSTLQGMPHLKLLALHSAIRKDGNALPVPDLWLPQLLLLSLQSEDWSGAKGQIKLLQHLQLPQMCGLDLGLPSASIFEGRSRDVDRFVEKCQRLILQRVGGMGPATTLTPADTPQIEIGVRPTTNGCQLTLGTVQHPDLTLSWNGEQGSSPVLEYLDIHGKTRPRFPPLNVMFHNATISDAYHIFQIVSDAIWKASYVRVHLEADLASHPSVGHVASALPSLISRMLQLKVLKLDKGSSGVVKSLFILVPSSAIALTLQSSGFSSLNMPILRNLERIVLDIGQDEADSTGWVPVIDDSAIDEVEKYAAWRKNHGFPIEVVKR
jgi:hypothetical protein